ncbi:nucleotidyltransferase domain-containing protein [Elusimicrobiota bacterium]
MRKRPDLLRFPLSWVFASSGNIAILRVLQDNREGMSGRAIAKEAGINHQACAVALKKLEAIGIIKRRGSGKTQLIRINFDHFLAEELVLAALRREKDMFPRAFKNIVDSLRDLSLSVTVFGSAAVGETEPGSDIDLMIIVKAENKGKVLNQVRTLSAKFAHRYGFRLSPIVLTAGEVKARAGKSDQLIKSILKHGVDLLSRKFKEILR